jgi:hypothetical protein
VINGKIKGEAMLTFQVQSMSFQLQLMTPLSIPRLHQPKSTESGHILFSIHISMTLPPFSLGYGGVNSYCVSLFLTYFFGLWQGSWKRANVIPRYISQPSFLQLPSSKAILWYLVTGSSPVLLLLYPRHISPKMDNSSTFHSTKNTSNQQVGVENSLIEGLWSAEGTDSEMEANLNWRNVQAP